jgi:hypothetical protein
MRDGWLKSARWKGACRGRSETRPYWYVGAGLRVTLAMRVTTTRRPALTGKFQVVSCVDIPHKHVWNKVKYS